MDPDAVLDGLDASQRQAVTEPTQPLAILAGAGSGKTRVLTRRIAYRCATGDADARRVLAVTFTRRAAGSLVQRLQGMGLRDRPTAGTFHTLALAQLRAHWTATGQTPPAIVDRKVPLLGRVVGRSRRLPAADLAVEIEWAKARLIGPADYPRAVAQADRRLTVDPEQVADGYARYEEEKRRRRVVDFDDLLGRCTGLLVDDPSFAAAQRWRFRHLFVDEYQDVNPLQESLLRAWLGERTDLCVVGDPNQAIYGWNGADAGYLVRFGEQHPGAAVVRLTDSYRSTPQILAAAALVRGRGSRRVRPLRAHRGDGPTPTVTSCPTDQAEAETVARALRDHHQPNRGWSAQAVLVRTNAQATLLDATLRRAAIPTAVRGAHRLLEEPEVRDLLRRLGRSNVPLHVTLVDLDDTVAEQRGEVLAAYRERDDPPVDVDEQVEMPDTAVGRRLAAYEQVTRLAHDLLALDPDALTRDLPGWLRTTLSDPDERGVAGRRDAVAIVSLHAAKGLEWDVVHLAGCEAGFLPISHARTPEARAEEERLFYVGVTRAAEVLRCTWAATRTFGTRVIDRRPSPYLAWLVPPAPADTTTPDPAVAPATPAPVLVAAPGPSFRSAEEALTHDLSVWRDDQARRAAVEPTVVLSDRSLRALAADRPTTEERLAELPGIGPALRRRHGARLLAIVARHHAADPPASPQGEQR